MILDFTPPCGPITAVVDDDVIRARGIRYATASRFAAPVPAADHIEPFLAETPAPASPQFPSPALTEVLGAGANPGVQDEDCQRLSITMPIDLLPGEHVPVMVWIHGGSYLTGCGDIAVMDPRPLVAEQRVIVVTVTYRLGILGFLGDPDGDPARPANLGLLDIITALRWVRRNIAAFGGDTGRITAFGQSAGADAIAHVMTLPEAPELFSRAILQSAPFGIRHHRLEMSRALFEAARSLSPETPLAELMARQPEVVEVGRGFGLRGGMAFGCQYGLNPLPAEENIEAAWDSTAPNIDVLVGHTAEETRLFIAALPKLARAVTTPVVGPLLAKAATNALTRRVYGKESRSFARRHVAAGGRAHHYVISWSAPGNPLGSAHTIDLPLLFGDQQAWVTAGILTGVTWSEIEAAARRVRRVWGAFARGDDLGEDGELPGILSYTRV
ncbi:carboxylesterase family protein [Mycetocola sp. JXN-3]|uniref:carboxylesterase family protein n=1 Tax=Mycetocola sp. JXN-3 TaxID=2116510 RepID=UPI00351C2608